MGARRPVQQNSGELTETMDRLSGWMILLRPPKAVLGASGTLSWTRKYGLEGDFEVSLGSKIGSGEQLGTESHLKRHVLPPRPRFLEGCGTPIKPN